MKVPRPTYLALFTLAGLVSRICPVWRLPTLWTMERLHLAGVPMIAGTSPLGNVGIGAVYVLCEILRVVPLSVNEIRHDRKFAQ